MKKLLSVLILMIIPTVSMGNANFFKAVNNADGTVYRSCGANTATSLTSGSTATFACLESTVRIYDSGASNYDSVNIGSCTGSSNITKISISGSASNPTVSSSCEAI